MKHWHEHPHVRSGEDLSIGDRAADRMRNGMGSWPFIFGALLFLGAWMVSDGIGADPRPWIILNLILSCLAALQGGILLIAAKRQDAIASQLALGDYQVNQQALELIKATHALVQQLVEEKP